MWATIIFVQRQLPPTAWAEQGYPFYSPYMPYGCRLGYHQSEAWPVEQKALPLQFWSINKGCDQELRLLESRSRHCHWGTVLSEILILTVALPLQHFSTD